MNNVVNYSLYLFFGVLPSLVWLNFYLRRDVRPEPKLMIVKIFFYGFWATLPAFFLETAIIREFGKLNLSPFLLAILNIFLGVALIEESLKFLVVKDKVLTNPEFDEPVDAMIYMIIVALGFAAGENLLVLFPLKSSVFPQIFGVSLLRFLGATFLHTLASGIFGGAIGLSLGSRGKKWQLIFVGLILAVLLHGFYNFSIMEIEGNLKFLIPSTLLIISAFFVSLCFKKLKKIAIIS